MARPVRPRFPLRLPAAVLAALPGLWLLAQAAAGQLGPRPWETLNHETGAWTLRLLVATLAITPLRRVLRWGPLLRVRQPLGVATAVYALAHLACFAGDHGFDLGFVAAETVRRTYLLLGLVALLALMALAATSNDAAVRRLRAERWQRLHRLVWVAAGLAALHALLQARLGSVEPAVMAGIVVWLALFRWLPQLPGPAALAGLAVAVAGLVGGVEAVAAAWTLGSRAWALLAANLQPFLWPRPVVVVLGLGLAVAGLAAWRQRPERGQN
ncbi:MAG: ferric reductase-like transmembrane domain-containing protein [Geminicoccaceae bacterium]